MANTDRLDTLFSQFPVQAEMFHAGALCGFTDFAAPSDVGQLHLIRAGVVQVIHSKGADLHIDTPSLLLYPRPHSRRFITDAEHGADFACANLRFDGGSHHPVVAALPEVICLPLTQLEGAAAVLTLLFDEAFGENCGRRIMVNRLFEVVLLQVMRCLMEADLVHGGMLAGLSHPKLRKALIMMHDDPAAAWTLDALANGSGMSRSLFAATFRQVVGVTPGIYLQGWRIRLAQRAIRQGRSLKTIIHEIGYGSEAALSRAFKASCGMTPREWRAAL